MTGRQGIDRRAHVVVQDQPVSQTARLCDNPRHLQRHRFGIAPPCFHSRQACVVKRRYSVIHPMKGSEDSILL